MSFEHVYRPGHPGKPLLLLLHGTGGGENDLVELGAGLAPGWPLLSPRGKVDEHGAARFFRRLAEGVFDEEDLIFRTQELAEWVRAFKAENDLEDRPVYALGYSNGANIAGSLLLLQPDVLAGGVLLRPMRPILPAVNPDLTGKTVLMMAGEWDRMIPRQSTDQMHELLIQCGADVELITVSAGHELTRTDFAQAQAILGSVGS